VLDDRSELERQWGHLWTGLEDAFAKAREGELALRRSTLPARARRPARSWFSVLELSGLTVGGGAAVGTSRSTSESAPTSDLGRDPEPPRRGRGSLSLVRRLGVAARGGEHRGDRLSFLGQRKRTGWLL